MKKDSEVDERPWKTASVFLLNYSATAVRIECPAKRETQRTALNGFLPNLRPQ